MNAKALINFLRHLLVLLLLLQALLGIAIIIRSETCTDLFDAHILVPYNLFDVYPSAHIAVYLILTVITTLFALSLLLALIGFKAAASLIDWPLFNFATGSCLLLLSYAGYLCAIILSYLDGCFDLIVRQNLLDMFNSVNGFIKVSDKFDINTYMDQYNSPIVDGWSEATVGTKRNKSGVDFIQVMFSCCGVSGRADWAMRIPRSCCASEIPDDKCMLMNAFDKGCDTHYDDYESCMSSLYVEVIVSSTITSMACICSLYLAWMVNRLKSGYVSSLSLLERTNFAL